MTTIRTYQRRNKNKENAIIPTLNNTSTTLELKPSFMKATTSTPIWHKKLGFESDDSENEGISPNLIGFEPKKQFLRGFKRGTLEDQKFLEEWLETKGIEFPCCVPATWLLSRQNRFAAWCQLLGFSCSWEGGYLWITFTKNALDDLKWSLSNYEDDIYSPLPAPPRPTLQGIANRFSAMTLNFEDGDDAKISTRNRPRKWQHNSLSSRGQMDSDAFQRYSSTLERRSSLGARRSSIGGRRSSLEFGRRSSVEEDFTFRSIRPSAVSLAPIPERRSSIALVNDVLDENTIKTLEAVAKEKKLVTEVAMYTDDIQDEFIISRIIAFLPVSLCLQQLTCLSKKFKSVIVNRANEYFARHSEVYLRSDLFFEFFTSGKFLAEGAYKSVYRVNHPISGESEAISVMDVQKIVRYGDPSIVAREVHVSLIVSEFVTKRICPNFIQTYQVFQLKMSPNDTWGNGGGEKQKSKINSPHQYIRMELCQGGDLEEHMKTYPGGYLPLKQSKEIIFQMIYALYAARRAAKLRHYDVKCLNFFCKTSFVEGDGKYFIGNQNEENTENEEAPKYIQLSNLKILLKLADYGTADLSTINLGKPVDVCHFTTLENTPMEFLLFSNAPQSFAADTFQLGLCILHVLTGAAPYEEILESVQCPSALMEAVATIWEESPGKEFEILRYVLNDDDDNVLYHTLYRYLVLFGFNSNFSGENESEFSPFRSKVFEAILDVLGPESGENSSKGLKAKKMKQARKQFAKDSAKYSLRNGTHHLIARGRERAKSLGIWDDLLWKCLDFDPKSRITTQQALFSTTFQEWIRTEIKEEDVVFGQALSEMEYEEEGF